VTSPAWRRALVPAALVAVFLVVAWSRVLDEWSLAYLREALAGSGAIYATARSVNALVSVLQGTEVNAVFVSFTIGEVLDPINDLIERFSGLVLLALGSLALQQLLIGIISHEATNVLFTVAVLASLALSLRAPPPLRQQSLRVLVFVLTLRLLLPVIVLGEGAIERIYLRDAEAEHLNNIEGFRNQLETVGRQVGVTGTGTGGREELEAALLRIDARRLEDEEAYARTRRALEEARAYLDTLPTASVWKPWVDEPQIVVDARAEIDRLEELAAAQALALDRLEAEGESLRDDIDCLDRRAAGESCSLAEGAMGLVRAADLRPQLAELSGRVDAFSSDLIQLLTSLLFKSVLLPLASLWLAMRISAAVARRLGF
jgi:hypothetical protein